MASIGLFDVKGLTSENPSFQIGSPAFDRITIKLNKDYYSGDNITIQVKDNQPGKTFVIEAKIIIVRMFTFRKHL